MHTARKLTSLVILIAGAAIPALAQPSTELVGSYLFRFEWGGTRLRLKHDGTFIKESSDCTGVTTAAGPYFCQNGLCEFTTKKLYRRENSEKKQHDLTKAKERKRYLDTDEPFRPSRYQLQVIKWKDRIYLMDSTEFESFIDAINLGFEPRAVDGYRPLYGYFYLREGDENKSVEGRPPLPNEFLANLLPAPITATVVKLETVDGKSIATIDRGSADGLRNEMPVVEVERKSFYYDNYWIISVDVHSAQVQVSGDVKVGDQLSTRVSDVRKYARALRASSYLDSLVD
jgi:hypothetical protein